MDTVVWLPVIPRCMPLKHKPFAVFQPLRGIATNSDTLIPFQQRRKKVKKKLLALLALEEKLMSSSKVDKIFNLDLTELALMVLKREEARLKMED
jgi:hypothetical protein